MTRTAEPNARPVAGATQIARGWSGRSGLAPPTLNTIGAVMVSLGCLLGALVPPRFEVTVSVFAPAATLLSNHPRFFWMWWAILAGLAVFVAWQWRPSRRNSQRLATICLPAATTGGLFLAWVVAAQAGKVATSIILLVAAIAALYLVVRRFAKYPASALEHLATDTGWGLALGFLSVQLLMNVGVVVEAYGLASDQLYQIITIGAYIAFLTGALGLAGRLYHQFAVGLALVWGFGWMGWERLTSQPGNRLLAALAGVGCFIIVAAFYASGRRRRKSIPGLAD